MNEKQTWERVTADRPGEGTARLAVPGGWLYRTIIREETCAVSLVFVPVQELPTATGTLLDKSKWTGPDSVTPNPLDGYENHQLLTELRDRGLVVCAFGCEEVIFGHCPDEIDSSEMLYEAQHWLDLHHERLVEAMTMGGNNYIAFAVDPLIAPHHPTDELDRELSRTDLSAEKRFALETERARLIESNDKRSLPRTS